jgi:hypothetical protein
MAIVLLQELQIIKLLKSMGFITIDFFFFQSKKFLIISVISLTFQKIYIIIKIG